MLMLAIRLFLIGAVAAIAGAQPASQSSTAAAPPDGYFLRVTSASVNVRSRADRNSVAVTRVARDSVLIGDGEEFGWHRVRPPAGAFCYVASQFVLDQGDGVGLVSVQSGALRARVGSTIASVDPAHGEVQALLPSGSFVRIVGRDGEWLRIEPPESVRVFVAADFVERIDAQVAARLRPAAGGGAAGDPASSAPAGELPEPPDLSGEWGRKLAAIESQIASESARDPLDADWARLAEPLKPIAAQREEPRVALLAARWVERLAQRRSDQAVLREARQITEKESRAAAQFEREIGAIGRAREPETSQPAFAARGILLPSFVVVGDQRRQFKLQDPFTLRVAAYVDFPPEAGIDPEQYQGQLVGVQGHVQRDAGLGADRVRVSHLTPLRPGPASQPSRQPR
ncbi:hypothetical protein RAS1_12630 [Phycisphaerae bacterium RAS1]|nr:hypothetical protein RAS1_12630 [Phycisphaerae bacterium RAS1]